MVSGMESASSNLVINAPYNRLDEQQVEQQTCCTRCMIQVCDYITCTRVIKVVLPLFVGYGVGMMARGIASQVSPEHDSRLVGLISGMTAGVVVAIVLCWKSHCEGARARAEGV
jgi:hypothetical protein